MKVKLLKEAGYEEALLGLSLSYLQPIENMPRVALKLLPKGEPHCKYLRQIHLWILVTGPWYWWKHFQTYNVGVDWPDFQSSSTMHKLLSRPLRQEDFERPVDVPVLMAVNKYIRAGDIEAAGDHLPGGFLYTRMLCMNYTSLRNIVLQRTSHKLPDWALFIEQIKAQVQHPEFLGDKDAGYSASSESTP